MAVGAGLALALAADIAVVGKGTRLLDGHLRLGVAAGDHAVLLWPLLVGMAKAKYHLLLNEPLTWEEAECLCLVALAVEDEKVYEKALEVAERLARLTLPPGRMETREVGGVVFVNDAYNANPLSVKAGLRWLAAQPGRKWAVLGEMRELGRESLRLHLEVAEEAARLGLSPLYLGPHARHQAAFSGEAVESLEEALAWLKARVAPGDLVYLKAYRAVGLERIVELWDAPFSS